MISRKRLRFSNCAIECTRSLYEAGSSMTPHHHNDTTLVFTLGGSYLHTMRSRAMAFTTDGLLYLPAGETHSDAFGSGGATCLITHLHASWAGQRLERPRDDVSEPRVSTGGYYASLIRKIYQEFRHPDSFSSLIVEGTMLELLGRWFREGNSHSRQPPHWLHAVKALLHDSFREPISLLDLSRATGVHPSHVAREFHRFFGQTVGEYVRRLRVEAVLRALQSTDKKTSLTDLAFQAGFSNHAHMSSIFKPATGMTPSQFRKSNGSTSIP